MPTLAAYFDTSSVSFLLKKDLKNIELFKFPYVYSKGAFSNQCSEQDFNQSLINYFLLSKDVKGKCDLLVSGFPNPPLLVDKPKLSVPIGEVVDSSTEFYPVLVNRKYFVAPGVSNLFSIIEESTFSPDEKEGNDYIENLAIYPQMITDEISIQSAIDKNLVETVFATTKFNPGYKILLGGGRFCEEKNKDELIPILALSLLSKSGVYEVVLDRKNAFPLIQLMKMYDRKFTLDVEDYVDSYGTFILTGGSVECLVKSGIGENQFMDVPKDRINVFPLSFQNGIKAQVKGTGIGTVDFSSKGGSLGFVFDTRSSRSSIYSDSRLFNECVKQFGKGIIGE